MYEEMYAAKELKVVCLSVYWGVPLWVPCYTLDTVTRERDCLVMRAYNQSDDRRPE